MEHIDFSYDSILLVSPSKISRVGTSGTSGVVPMVIRCQWSPSFVRLRRSFRVLRQHRLLDRRVMPPVAFAFPTGAGACPACLPLVLVPPQSTTVSGAVEALHHRIAPQCTPPVALSADPAPVRPLLRSHGELRCGESAPAVRPC